MSILEQLDTTTLLVGGALTLSLLWWLSTRRPAGLPPGPGLALPVLGHLHLMDKDPRAKFHKWRRQYGDIFSLYMGSRLVVVLNGFPVIKEAFVKFADNFSDRPHMVTFDKINGNEGIVFSEGAAWKEQRKTAIDILRDLGMGKNMLAEKVQEEVTHFMRAIEEHQGEPTDLHRLTSISVSNNICSIMFGKRFEYDDPLFIKYTENVDEYFKHLGSASIINFLPFLEYIPGDIFKAQQVLSNARFVENTLFRPQLDIHRKMVSESETTDFIDGYLREMKKRKKQGEDTTLSETQLLKSLADLFNAGTETTSTVISWALLLFLHYPHVQAKCYEEICDAIGTHRPPTMHDRANIIYIEATINEILRWADIGPLGGSHTTLKDVSFRGYVIPREAVIMPFLTTALHDPEVWGDPECFRPERFIGPDGKLTRPDEFIPFGIGRRMCMGEALARTEMFLYLATLVQHFHFLPSEPDTLPPLEGILGITYIPKHYKIRAVRRE